MIPYIQDINFDDPQGRKGNCWQTAIAAVLELEPQEVPHFVQADEDGIKNWWTYTYEWLWWRGYNIEVINRHLYTNEYYFVSGKSPRGDLYHVVVYRNGKMVHDPHESQAGILTEEQFEVIRPIR